MCDARLVRVAQVDACTFYRDTAAQGGLREVTRWLPKLSEEFTFGQQEDVRTTPELRPVRGLRGGWGGALWLSARKRALGTFDRSHSGTDPS